MKNKYLRVEIESKGFVVDLDYVKSQDIKIQLGTFDDKEKKVFTCLKNLTLEDLENGGFKLD